MQRVPLLSGTRLHIATVPDDAVVLRPPPPSEEPIADVAAAVRDAFRFPLAGDSLEAVAPRGGRATILAELPSLPIPGAHQDPRREALGATFDVLRQAGIPLERQTLVVTGGLARRPGRRELEELVSPHVALGFSGEVVVHDVEDPDLFELGSADGVPLRINRHLVETDLVVVVSAAETVLDGGPGALLMAGGAEALRAASARSLLETANAAGWELALAAERELARRVPLLGVSLALDQPRVAGALRGYPYEEAAVERVARSPLGRLFRLLPAAARARLLHSLPVELTTSAVFAGPPSVAHAEALLRAIEARSAGLAEPLDVVCIGIPRTTPHLPRERPNPLLAAYLGLGLALRLWRDAFPVREGGTAILLHRFHRHFTHPTQQPYRAFFQATRAGREPEALEVAETAVGRDPRAIEAYRSGRTCHPVLPFADWTGCAPALERLGAVLIAGCRDSVAARQLGFVPTHGLSAALAMAEGLAQDGPPRVGYLLAPPYFPIRVG